MDNQGFSIHSGPNGGMGKYHPQSQPSLTLLFLFLASTASRISFLLCFCQPSGWFCSFWSCYLLQPGLLRSTSVLFLLVLSVPQNCASSASPVCPHDLNIGPFNRVPTAVCPMFPLKHAISYNQGLSAVGVSGSRTVRVWFDVLLGSLVDTQYPSASRIRVRLTRYPKHRKDYGVPPSYANQNKIK